MSFDADCTNLSCCSDVSRAADGSNGIEFGDHRLDSDQLIVQAAAFRLLLESGEPAAITSIAATGGIDPATATEVLEVFARTGNVSLKGDRVMGIAGLTRPVDSQRGANRRRSRNGSRRWVEHPSS